MASGFGIAAVDDHSDHLTAVWDMDEASGARADSVGSNNLTDNATVTSRAGKSDLAAEFDDGNNEYLSIVDNADLSPTTGFAISLWVYMDVLDAHQGIFGKAASFFCAYYNDADKLTFYVYQSDTVSKVIKTVDMATGGWHHLIAMAADSFTYLYLDNASVGTPVAYDDTVKDNANAFRIGANHSTDYWDGAIDEVAFWKNISFADQTAREAFVAGLWNGGDGRFYGELGVTIGPIQTQSRRWIGG